LEPAVGDFGFIVCCSRDISNVVKTPGQANPGSFRTHSFSDGFFVPCSFNKAAPGGSVWLKTDGSLQLTTKDGVVIKSDGSGNLTITTQGNTTLNASGGAVDITATTTTFHGDVAVTGKVTANGEVTANNGASKVTLTQHRHSANNTPPTPGF
jgi:phage baseplate assembly protein gpV